MIFISFKRLSIKFVRLSDLSSLTFAGYQFGLLIVQLSLERSGPVLFSVPLVVSFWLSSLFISWKYSLGLSLRMKLCMSFTNFSLLKFF